VTPFLKGVTSGSLLALRNTSAPLAMIFWFVYHMFHILQLPERPIPVCDPVLYPCANNARVEQFIVGKYEEGLCWD
jgi:hypothetical protein